MAVQENNKHNKNDLHSLFFFLSVSDLSLSPLPTKRRGKKQANRRVWAQKETANPTNTHAPLPTTHAHTPWATQPAPTRPTSSESSCILSVSYYSSTWTGIESQLLSHPYRHTPLPPSVDGGRYLRTHSPPPAPGQPILFAVFPLPGSCRSTTLRFRSRRQVKVCFALGVLYR